MIDKPEKYIQVPSEFGDEINISYVNWCEERIAELEKQVEWIRFSDEPPPINEIVWVYTEHSSQPVFTWDTSYETEHDMLKDLVEVERFHSWAKLTLPSPPKD